MLPIAAVLRHSRNVPLRSSGFRLSKKRQRDGIECCVFLGRRFFFKAADAWDEVGENELVIDMERMGKQGRRHVAFGRVYACMTFPQLQNFMLSLNYRDAHLYESLGNRPHKLILDLDRALTEEQGSAFMVKLDDALYDCFLPFLCRVLSAKIRLCCDSNMPELCARDFVILDASLAQRKYSKHLMLNRQIDGKWICARDRRTEHFLMTQVKAELEEQIATDERLRRFCKYTDKFDVEHHVVDFSIYTTGKRSMRIVGSCKGNGKQYASPTRTLRPCVRMATDLPWPAYLANTGGQACVLYDAGTMPQNGRSRMYKALQTTQQRTQLDVKSIDSRIIEFVLEASALVHPAYHSRKVCAYTTDNIEAVSCSINYAAMDSEPRSCAFAMQPHSRHYAVVTAFMNGQLDYYCHGCRESVRMYTCEVACATPAYVPDELSIDYPGTRVLCQSRFLPPLRPYVSEAKCTCLIRSPMGTGKTHAIAELLSKNSSRVLSIGFRQTLNASLARRFGLVNYSDVKGSLYGVERLSVQVDSLHRLLKRTCAETHQYSLYANYEIVIVDELESLLSHFNAQTMTPRLMLLWKIFVALAYNTQSLLLCDADLSTRGSAFVKGLGRPVENTVTLVNTVQYHSPTVVVYKNERPFSQRLLRSVRRGLKVYVASNSRKFAIQARAALLAKTAAKVLLIEGRSDPRLKLDTANCEQTWAQYDVVLCTPAVAAGVDFSADHFDCTFVYGQDKSGTPRELHQQIGRVRKLAQNKVYVCLVESPFRQHRDAPPTLASARDDFACRTEAVLDGAVACEGHTFTLGVCPTLLKDVLCHTMHEAALSSYAFSKVFLQMYEHKGGNIVHMPTSVRCDKSYVAGLEQAVFDAELQSAANICASPLCTAADLWALRLNEPLTLDNVQVVENSHMHRKTEICCFYGGYDLRNAEALFVIGSPLYQRCVSNAVHLCIASSALRTCEQENNGALYATNFEIADGGDVHSTKQNVVLEKTRPLWLKKHDASMLAYACGVVGLGIQCSKQSIKVEGDCNVLHAILQHGMNSVVSAERMANDIVQIWLRKACLRLLVSMDKPAIACETHIADSKALVAFGRAYFSFHYGLVWSRPKYVTHRKQRLGQIRKTEPLHAELFLLALGMHLNPIAPSTRYSADVLAEARLVLHDLYAMCKSCKDSKADLPQAGYAAAFAERFDRFDAGTIVAHILKTRKSKAMAAMVRSGGPTAEVASSQAAQGWNAWSSANCKLACETIAVQLTHSTL